jgi:hypothetical protein
MLGRWTVDHESLRERSDTYNLTFQPRFTVKDFKLGRAFDYNDHTEDCMCTPTAGSQPRWQVPLNSTLVASNSTMERWRAFHESIHESVDFFIALDGSRRRSSLPYLLLYYGNCTSGTKIDPASEVLVQSNQYYNFSLATRKPASLYLFRPHK